MRVCPIEIDWNPGLSVYASEFFMKSVSDEYGWLGGIDDEGTLRCVLPFTIIRKANVRMVRFRVETIPIGREVGIEEEKEYLDNITKYFRSNGEDIIIPATTNAIFRTFPRGAIAAPYGTLIIDLDQTEETLWKHIHPKHRNVIRNSEKKGVNIRRGIEYAGDAYPLIRSTFKRSKLPFLSEKAFMRMVNGLDPFIEIFVAEYEGDIQGCAVIPYSNHSAYYVYGGSVPHPLIGSMNHLQWTAIRHFQARQVKRYDFCGVRIDPKKGSKQAGLKMFKERFGPELVQGYMWKCALNPIKSGIYTLAVRILRGGDIVDAEKHKLGGEGSIHETSHSGLQDG